VVKKEAVEEGTTTAPNENIADKDMRYTSALERSASRC